MTTSRRYVMRMNVKKRRSQVECVSNKFLDDMFVAVVMVETANWTILCI